MQHGKLDSVVTRGHTSILTIRASATSSILSNINWALALANVALRWHRLGTPALNICLIIIAGFRTPEGGQAPLRSNLTLHETFWSKQQKMK